LASIILQKQSLLFHGTTDVPTVEESGTNSTYSLKIAVTTADTSIGSNQQYSLRQIVEGYNARSFGFGKPGTRYVTLSFWHKFSKTGVYCVSFRNCDYSRSYVAEFTQSSANTWEKAVITIPVDTTGTWLYDNGIGIIVTFALAAGTNFITTPNTWQSGVYLATSNQVNGLDSTSNTFLFSQIQLEEGEIATKFEERPYSVEFALCQRYYEKTYNENHYQGQTTDDGVVVLSGYTDYRSRIAVYYKYSVCKRVPGTMTCYTNGGVINKFRYQIGSTYYDGDVSVIYQTTKSLCIEVTTSTANTISRAVGHLIIDAEF
jgi:hypothetical protein